jgi:hypothetical protein
MKRTKKESHARNKSTLGLFTLEVMHQMCDNLGLCFEGMCGTLGLCFEDPEAEEVPMGLTVRQLELIQPIKLLCEFLCEHKEQLNQIRSYNEYELLMLAKFEAFSKAKQRALFTLEDINSVEKLQKYIICDRQKSRKCKPMLKTLRSLCKLFNLSYPGNEKTKLVEVCTYQ